MEKEQLLITALKDCYAHFALPSTQREKSDSEMCIYVGSILGEMNVFGFVKDEMEEEE